MRAKGITYDTGFVRDGTISRTDFGLPRVRRELGIIRDDLHCTAVHLVGGDPERLEIAARLAADLGLEVWFSPYPIDLTPDETLTLFADCATRAEQVRSGGAEVVFVAGVELSLMNRGFVEGDRIDERLRRLLANPALFADARDRLGAFLPAAARTVRERFHGKVTYAAIPFEDVDWDLFDIITLELIRSAEVEDQFPEGVRRMAARPKPFAVTGFGTATWRGSGAVAPRSMEVLEHDEVTGQPVRITGVHERDEDGQAAYLGELLEIFGSSGVDSAFVHLFALDSLPHRPDGDPRVDLDLASPGIVKVFEHGYGVTYPDMPWEPKAAFATVAAAYRSG